MWINLAEASKEEEIVRKRERQSSWSSGKNEKGGKTQEQEKFFSLLLSFKAQKLLLLPTEGQGRDWKSYGRYIVTPRIYVCMHTSIRLKGRKNTSIHCLPCIVAFLLIYLLDPSNAANILTYRHWWFVVACIHKQGREKAWERKWHVPSRCTGLYITKSCQ